MVKSYTPESVCTLEISPRRMASPSYLQPAMGLWDWIIWRRLVSHGSGIHMLLKAIWQGFHTVISVAGALTDRPAVPKEKLFDFLSIQKNVKQSKWAQLRRLGGSSRWPETSGCCRPSSLSILKNLAAQKQNQKVTLGISHWQSEKQEAFNGNTRLSFVMQGFFQHDNELNIIGARFRRQRIWPSCARTFVPVNKHTFVHFDIALIITAIRIKLPKCFSAVLQLRPLLFTP